MRKYGIGIAVLAFAVFAVSLRAAPPQSRSAPSNATLQSLTFVAGVWAGAATSSLNGQIAADTLPSDVYKKAHHRSRIRFVLALVSFVYGLVVLWAMLHWKLGVKYRDWAERLSHKRFLQAIVYGPLLLITITVFTAPLDVYSEIVEKEFGISVQGWGSWSWDWVQEQLISIIIFTILIWLLYSVIRKSPRRWWFYFWLISVPIIVLIVFITPLMIDPLFHKFEPLQQKDPALTASLEQLVQRTGENIPPERMFWMGAAEKTTALDAYVTGIGASKRLVVYDTTIAKATVPEYCFFGRTLLAFFLFGLPVDRMGTGALGTQVGDSRSRRLGLFAGPTFLVVSVLVCGQSGGERLQPASGASSRPIRPGSDACSHSGFRSGGGPSISEDRRSRFGGPGSESGGCLSVLRPSNYARPRSVFLDV